MPGERQTRILARLIEHAQGGPEAPRLCEVCAEVTEMTGAGVMLMYGESPSGSLCTTNEVSARLEDLQYTLGEGPCVDAYHQDRPVIEPDLLAPATPRWLAFTPAAVDAGARAVFGFPLRVGAIRLGSLNLYRDAPGHLTDDQHADALTVASVAGRAVLLMQAGAPPGDLADEIERGADFHLVVHQAAGMVAVQSEITVVDALVRLRAHSFATSESLLDVARAVVGRSLRFDPEPR